MFNTDFVFTRGKLTITLDGGAGSSGKGKLGSFLCEHAGNWTFACNTFMPQAGHWVKLEDGREFLYQTFNSCAYLTDRYEKLYIAPGATIDLPAFWRELEQNNIPRRKIGISPATAILQDIDTGYERGTCDLEGDPIRNSVPGGPLVATGSTRKGCGANRARRALRHKKAKFARDEPQLREFLCDVPCEIMDRLDDGQAGLLEIAQGFQLSYLLPEMGRHTTSRNCTVAAGLDDLMVPPYYVGKLVLNFRTYPIRIHDHVYEDEVGPQQEALWAPRAARHLSAERGAAALSQPHYHPSAARRPPHPPLGRGGLRRAGFSCAGGRSPAWSFLGRPRGRGGSGAGGLMLGSANARQSTPRTAASSCTVPQDGSLAPISSRDSVCRVRPALRASSY